MLDKFRSALTAGLKMWGLQLNSEPWCTKELAILADVGKKFPPRNTNNSNPQTTTSPSVMPSLYLFTSIVTLRTTAEDRAKNLKTAQLLAKFNRTPHVHESNGEVAALKYIHSVVQEHQQQQQPLIDAVVGIVTDERQSRAVRWLVAECLKTGVLPILLPGATSDKKQRLLCDNFRLNCTSKFSTDPIKGLDAGKEVPAISGKSVLVVGIDTCHTHDVTTGAVAGVLITPKGNHLLPSFWRNEIRGQELEQVTQHFVQVISKACDICGTLDEVVVFQDGNVFAELESMKAVVPRGTGLTFMCLHKRTNIRFVHKSQNQQNAANVIKGTIIQSLTPILSTAAASGDDGTDADKTRPPTSFYLQNHDCNMSTARTVQYTVHATSRTLDVSDVQRLSFCLSHVASPMPTKLPMSTRCAHKLSAVVERLVDACPDFKDSSIPKPLANRLWFL